MEKPEKISIKAKKNYILIKNVNENIKKCPLSTEETMLLTAAFIKASSVFE